MLDLFNIAKPQNCDIQTFYGAGSATSNGSQYSWIKPRGVSFVYMLLIGAGGNGDGTTGGGSGAITVWFGSAGTVPDYLRIQAGPGTASTIRGQFSSSTLVLLLQANAGSGSSGGAAISGNQFAASGFFQSIAGQNGSSSDPGASVSTFLNGGAAGSVATANYGYNTGRNGYFQMQPIIVGVGGTGAASGLVGGIGCGGGASSGIGGSGMVLIASW